MKPTIVLLFSSLAVALAAPPKTELTQVHKVYLLSMTNGMEQYLANRLTGLGVFQVVTDPMKADAIFTDGIGDAFESRLADWYPQKPAAPPEPAPAAQPPVAANPPAPAQPLAGATLASAPPAPPKVAASEPEKADQTASGAVGAERTTPVTAFHRAKGTLFLVDPRSRLVLWSIYAQPKDASSFELDRTAAYIAGRIRQDLKSH
jgi:hypothetical protein